MDPKYILIENFMSHKRTEIDCTKFQSVLIIGQLKSNPRESNGVGKTVIFHAIEYALFGTYPTSVIDGIVRDGTDVAKVVFDFIINDDIYRVERVRRKGKGTDVHLSKWSNDEFIDISQRTSTDTHKMLQKLIKINITSFKNSVQFSQSNIDGLISTRGKSASIEDRKNILKDALNLGRYQKYEKSAKESMLAFQKKMDNTKAVIESIGNPESEIILLEKNLLNTKNELVEKENIHNELMLSISSKKTEIVNLQKLISSDAMLTHNKLNEIKGLKGRDLKHVKNKRESIIDNTNKAAIINEQLEFKKKELVDLEERTDSVRAKKRRPLHKVAQEFENAAKIELNDKAFMVALEAKAFELKRPLPEGEECPTCHRGLSGKDREVCLSKLNDKLSELLDDIAEKKTSLKKVINKKSKLQNELEEINKAITFIVTMETKIDSKKSEVKNDEDYTIRLNSLNTAANSELDLLLKKIEECSKLEESLNESLKNSSNEVVEKKIFILQKDLSEIEYLKQGLVKEITEQNTRVGMCIAKIEGKQDSLIKLNDKKVVLYKLEYNFSLLKRARRAFSSSGIPTMIIHTILDDLQLEANKVLSELKPELEIQFTPDVDILYKYHGMQREFSQLSGGQKMIIALSLKLGLSIIIQRRIGVDIKFLQLDEVDQPMDHAAVDAYAAAIKKLQSKFKVFVITHNSSLKDKFSDVILVEGDEYNGATSRLISY